MSTATGAPTAAPSEPVLTDEERDTVELPLWSIALGLVLGLLGSIAINTGNNLQSMGLQELQKKEELDELDNGGSDQDEKPARAPSESRTWVVGTTVFVTGALLNFASYAFAPSVMLAPLESIQFVTNIIFGRVLLKKKIRKRMMVGTVLICGGTLMAVLTAGLSKPTALSGRPHSLKRQYMGETTNSELYLSYLALSVVSALFLHCVHKRYDKAFQKGTPLPGHRYVAPASYAAFSAIFGAQSVVQAKCLAILILYYVDRSEPGGLQGFGNMFLNYWTYVTLFAWVFFVAVWLYRMNEALGLYDPIFIIPLLQAGFIIFAIISGGIYFGEFSRFQPGHWLFFCFGIFFVCIGLPLLSPKDASDKKPSDIRRIQPLSSVPEEGGEPKTPTLDLAALEESTRSRRSPSLDSSPKPRSSFGDRPSSRPSSGSSSGRFDLTGSGMSRRLLSHVAVTSVASSHNFGSPRAVTAKGSSRRSLDGDSRRSLDGDLQRAEDGERKDPSMATI